MRLSSIARFAISVPLARRCVPIRARAAECGILELAVACEVGVKQHFFRPASPAEAAFAYLQDANRSTAPIIDFLNQIAKAAHGVSFRDDAPDDCRHIDYLFRCRNKVVHRGVAIYRDDRDDEHTPDQREVVAWWESVASAFDWLETRSDSK